MELIVITGGEGDIAKAIKNRLEGEFEVLTPGKAKLDVTDIAQVEAYFSDHRPDILINNAGYVVQASIAECDIVLEKKVIDINLFGTFNCTSAVLKHNPKAKIINIGSSAAAKVHGNWSSYCASKAGVVMATQCWADCGYDVVCISPGRTATKMRKGLFPKEKPDTLLKPEAFAEVVAKAVYGTYRRGEHINVTKDNVGVLLK